MNILSKRSNKVVKELVKERAEESKHEWRLSLLRCMQEQRLERKNQTYHPLILPGPPEP